MIGRGWRSRMIAAAAVVSLTACGGPAPSARPSSALGPSVAPSSTPAPTPSPTPSFQLIDMGGTKQAIDCRGSGSPTVVFDGGIGVAARTWSFVMNELTDADFSYCRYDRFGLGESEPSHAPRTSERLVAELRGLLAAAGARPPYVLVGQSFGGLNMQLFARQHPDEVVGVVMVDAIHPDLDVRLEPMLTAAQVTERRAELESNQEGMTFKDILTSEGQVREAPEFPAIPLVVLRHGVPFTVTDPTWPAEPVERLWLQLQRELSQLAPGGRLVVAEKSQHRIEETEPELVARTVREVVAAAGG